MRHEDPIQAAIEKTSWEVVGWHAWREAVKVRDALDRVEVRRTSTEGIPLRVLLRGRLSQLFDPRTNPDHYQPADLI